MNITACFYDLNDYDNDLIDAIGPIQITPQTASDLATYTLPGVFSIEDKNENGYHKLSVAKVSGFDLELSVNSGTGSAYKISPEPYISVYHTGGGDVLGGHPIRIFTLQPGGRR